MSSRSASWYRSRNVRRVEVANSPLDDHLGDGNHLWIDLTIDVIELRRPDLLGRAECDQRQAGAAWLDQNHPLAAAEGQATQTTMPDLAIAALMTRYASVAICPSG